MSNYINWLSTISQALPRLIRLTSVILLNKIELRPIPFAPIPCGPIPFCWLEPKIQVSLGAEGSIDATITAGIKLDQTTRTGVVWDNKIGWDSIGEFKPSWGPTYPDLNVEARVVGFLEVGPKIKIWGLTGPALSLKPYLKASVAQAPTIDPTCAGDLKAVFSAGAEAAFKWDLSSDTDLADLLGLSDTLEGAEDYLTFTLDIIEMNLKTWSFGSSCTDDNSHLDVRGNSINVEIEAPSNEQLDAECRLTNDGAATLAWTAEVRNDTAGGAVTLGPRTGLLGAGESTTVTAAVDASLLGVGSYRATLVLINEDGAIADPMGSTERFVHIKVLPGYRESYHWNLGPWGDCMGTCGTDNGVQTRTVTCQSTAGQTVADFNCTDIKPTGNRAPHRRTIMGRL